MTALPNRPLRVLVCGGRNFNDPLTLGSWLGGIVNSHGIAMILEGGARGADRMAREFAKWKGIPVETYVAEWDVYGRAAGPLRNREMLDNGKPDLVVAFKGGRGTANMVLQARQRGIPVFEPQAVQ